MNIIVQFADWLGVIAFLSLTALFGNPIVKNHEDLKLAVSLVTLMIFIISFGVVFFQWLTGLMIVKRPFKNDGFIKKFSNGVCVGFIINVVLHLI